MIGSKTKLVLGGLAGLAAFIGYDYVSNNKVKYSNTGAKPLTSEQLTAAGYEQGDTEMDVVRRLTAKNYKLEESAEQQARAVREIKQAAAEKAKLEEEEKRVAAIEFDEKLAEQAEQHQSEMQEYSQSMAALMVEVKTIKESVNARPDIAVNQRNTGSSGNITAIPGTTRDADGSYWLQTDGEPVKDSAFAKAKKAVTRSVNAAANTDITRSFGNSIQSDPGIRPAMTIAKNSTLLGAVAVTSLIGRIPKNGAVVDPYPFKVKIGQENFIANNQTVSGLVHAIVTGTATGDKTLTCVIGSVESITFVFEDKRIITIPSPSDPAPGTKKTPALEIGTLSDVFGNPCVPGTLFSDDAKNIAQIGLAAGIGAAAEAAASSQTTTSISGLGGVSGVTGSKNEYVLGEAVEGASDELVKLLIESARDDFAAVVVGAGVKVSIHITEELRIDYNDQGRLTEYDNFSTGTAKKIHGFY